MREYDYYCLAMFSVHAIVCVSAGTRTNTHMHTCTHAHTHIHASILNGARVDGLQTFPKTTLSTTKDVRTHACPWHPQRQHHQPATTTTQSPTAVAAVVVVVVASASNNNDNNDDDSGSSSLLACSCLLLLVPASVRGKLIFKELRGIIQMRNFPSHCRRSSGYDVCMPVLFFPCFCSCLVFIRNAFVHIWPAHILTGRE